MTATCGLASSFLTLLLGRIGVGVGEAGFQPPALVAHLRSLQGRSARLDSGHDLPGFPVRFPGWAIRWAAGSRRSGAGASRFSPSACRASCRPCWSGSPCASRRAALQKATCRQPSRRRCIRTAEGSVVVDTSAPPFARCVDVSQANFALNAVAQFVLPFYLRGFGLPLAVAGAVFGLVAFTSNGLGMLGRWVRFRSAVAAGRSLVALGTGGGAPRWLRPLSRCVRQHARCGPRWPSSGSRT